LKIKLHIEGREVYDKIVRLKLLADDNKFRETDLADTETILRLIQSIPSPKAEPFKLWLAKVGYERIEETEAPELTDEWQERGMKEGRDFAILTNEITKAWSDMNVKRYKEFKGLRKQNLRDNMTNLELVLNMLAEASTTEISKSKQPIGLEKNKMVANQGGTVAKKARNEIEKQTGKK
jgi:hypothetical protein